MTSLDLMMVGTLIVILIALSILIALIFVFVLSKFRRPTPLVSLVISSLSVIISGLIIWFLVL